MAVFIFFSTSAWTRIVATDLFVDQIALDSVHRLGLVQFNTAVVPFVAPDIFPFGVVNPGNATNAHNAIGSITAGGGTNILAGLQQGVSDLNVPSPSPRRVAVLFTDGRHNSPSVLSDAALQSDLDTEINAVSPSMELYSIGLGTSVGSVRSTLRRFAPAALSASKARRITSQSALLSPAPINSTPACRNSRSGCRLVPRTRRTAPP